MSPERIKSSFRDRSGSVYLDGDTVFRTVNENYRNNYTHLISSDLAASLWEKKLLIPFEETRHEVTDSWKTLMVERLPFISYPYEWCFSQLKDAALLTLDVQLEALAHGMVIKDASAYNVQFHGGKPVFIDCLSFEVLREGEPWVAYAQFCSHFLAPLALINKVDLRCGALSRLWIDGIPLELASKLLPKHTLLSPSQTWHLHLHAWMQKRHADTRVSAKKARSVRVSKQTLEGIAKSLGHAVKSLSPPKAVTEWGDYYSDTNYSDEAFAAKMEVVTQVASRLRPDVLVDIGANTGVFSRIAAEYCGLVVAADIDPLAVEYHYNHLCSTGRKNILPLIIDLTNPSPDLGWACEERNSFIKRCDAGLVLALALVHHLVIGNNVPFGMIAEFLAGIGSYILVEFVPKKDSQVQRLLATRKDIFVDYDEETFLTALEKYFIVEERFSLPESVRSIFLLRRI